MAQRSRVLAACLSLVFPGTGQLYNGDKPKGIALACIAVGLWAAVVVSMSRSSSTGAAFSIALLAVVYLFVMIPSATDAYRGAQDGQIHSASEKTWYVIVMLGAVGPLALPLLWQSPRLSRTAKSALTVVVIVVALLAIYILVVLGPILEQLLNDPSALEALAL